MEPRLARKETPRRNLVVQMEIVPVGSTADRRAKFGLGLVAVLQRGYCLVAVSLLFSFLSEVCNYRYSWVPKIILVESHWHW